MKIFLNKNKINNKVTKTYIQNAVWKSKSHV